MSQCRTACTLSAPDPARLWRWVKSLGRLAGRALIYPIRQRRERIRWLTEASGPEPPIQRFVPELSEGAQRVYAYLARRDRAFRVSALAHPHDRQGGRPFGIQGPGSLSGAHAYHVKPVMRA